MSSLLTGLAGKVVLITGASSGLGRHTAIEFAKNGCKIAISGRKILALKATQNSCQSEGKLADTHIFQIVADLENADDCKKVVEETVGKYGQLDVLVNAAGILTGGGIENLTLENYDKQMNINARSLFITTQTAVPHLKKTKGNIVNVSRPIYGLSSLEMDVQNFSLQ